MSEDGRLFLEACGASGPLRFEWADPATGEPRSQEVEQPALVVGRSPAADLVLDDPSVEPYHAFFQVVDGRLFAFDLESTDGLRWGEIPRAAGWVNRGQPLRIGSYTIRLVGGDREEARSAVQPAPTTSRYVSRLKLPEVFLEFRTGAAGKDGRHQRDVLDRVLVLAGSSEPCKLRVEGRNIAKFICALIRTVEGLWMTNIFPAEGATVNGAMCRFARLEDDDVIQLGSSKVRVIYNEAAQAPVVRSPYGHATESLGPASQPRAVAGIAGPVEASPELLLQPLLEQAGSETGAQSSPFGQALVMMVRLLGDVHRDHLTLVRDELAEIRRLSQDMATLRGQAKPREPAQLPLTVGDSLNGMNHAADFNGQFEDGGRPDPEAVKEIVSERLQAWEQERQNRWRKLLRLLTQP